MRKIFLLFVLFFSFNQGFSQATVNKTDANGLKQGKWVSKYPGGRLKYEGNFDQNKPIGDWKRYHENGKMKALMSYRPNSERVSAVLFDEAGKLYAKGVFESNLRDSTWNFYSGDKLILTENYSLGKKTGKAQGFNEQGAIMWVKGFKNDLPDGLSFEYYPSGIKRNEIPFTEGKKNGLATFYNEDGSKTIEGSYRDDLSDGSWKIFDKSGKLKYEVKYNKGEILNGSAIDSLQLKEFKKYDGLKGKIPEPNVNESGFPDNPR
jgi:antitoxin component YwqK of YwqJK toxin-antitoxin module